MRRGWDRKWRFIRAAVLKSASASLLRRPRRKRTTERYDFLPRSWSKPSWKIPVVKAWARNEEVEISEVQITSILKQAEERTAIGGSVPQASGFPRRRSTDAVAV